jgi:diacylglycerol kinase family enzyme
MASNTDPSRPPLMFVMNAGSGHNDATATCKTIEEILMREGRTHRINFIEDASRLGEIAKQTVEEAKACGGIVVAVGGDGTINAVANAVLGSGCPFGVLPQGTFNYFGRTHGISENIEESLNALLIAQPQPVQAGLLNGRLFLVNASVGLYPKLLEDREAFKQQYGRSRLIALWSGLVTLFHHHRQLRITLEQCGETTKLRTPTLFIGNNPLQMEQIGIPLAEDIKEGRLAAIAVKPVGVLSMLWLVIRGALGKLGNAENVISFSFRQLVVKPSSLYRSRRVKAAIDGETIWVNAPLEFKVSPVPLLLMKPVSQLALQGDMEENAK